MSYKIAAMLLTFAFATGQFIETSAVLTTVNNVASPNVTYQSTQGYQTQQYPNQTYQGQGYQYPGQAPVQTVPQGYPQQSYQQQGYPQQGYLQQNYQVAPQQGYQQQGSPQIQQPQMAPPQTPAEAKLQQDIAASEKTSNAWIQILDSGNYGASWDNASKALQATMKRNEWIQLMDAVRKPLGAVRQRSILDIRTAKNPPQAAPGDYMVYIYDTKFAGGEATELVTLQEYNGNWYIFTYNVSGK